MRKGELITLVLWILSALSWPVTLFLVRNWTFIFISAPLTAGAGAWTFVYFVFGIARWASARDKVEVTCECGHVNLVPVVEAFHTYENAKCEKCGRALQNHEKSA